MRICFALIEDNDVKKIICAHEDDKGKGSYIGMPSRDFESVSTEKKVELLNEMIIALVKAHEVKKNINFKDYQR